VPAWFEQANTKKLRYQIIDCTFCFIENFIDFLNWADPRASLATSNGYEIVGVEAGAKVGVTRVR
jgi:hypothetical protein